MKKQKGLDARLKDDASRLAPAFDARLHERVMESLDDVTESISTFTLARRPLFRIVPFSIAAMVLVGLGVWWGVGGGTNPTPGFKIPVASGVPSIPLPADLFAERATEIQRQIQQKMAGEPLAALNQDTVAFTSFVASQLDVVPTRGQRER